MCWNRRLLQYGLLLLLSVNLAVSANQNRHTQRVRLATLGPSVGNFAPVLYNEDNEVKGSMPDQIHCAFAALQIETQFMPVPIGRHIWAVDNHQADGYFPATSYEVNTSPLQTSIVLLESEMAMYSIHLLDLDAQPAPSVATVRMAMAAEKFIADHQLSVIKTSSYNQAIDLLLKQRVDAVIANSKGFELSAKNGGYHLSWHKQALQPVQLRLYLSPQYTAQHPAIFSRLNPELENCKAVQQQSARN